MSDAKQSSRTPVLFNWSSGKDSILALDAIQNSSDYGIHTLLTTVNDHYGRISQHGVRESLLDQQVRSLDLPLHKIRLPMSVDMEQYSSIMAETLSDFKKRGIEHAVYGDIFLERVRNYRERNLSTIGMKGVFPLWMKDTRRLAHKFIDEGYEAIVVCVNEQYLDRSFVGRPFDHSFLRELPESADPCGENGEFHTFVWNGPMFDSPVAVKIGETVYRNSQTHSQDEAQCPPDDDDDDVAVHTGGAEGLWFTDLLPAAEQ